MVEQEWHGGDAGHSIEARPRQSRGLFNKHLDEIGDVTSGRVGKVEELWNYVDEVGGDGSRLDEFFNVVSNNPTRFDELSDAIPRISKMQPPTIPFNLPRPGNLSAHNLSDANMEHFLEGHTYEYLNVSKRLKGSTPKTTLWESGTSPEQISDYLEDALELLASERRVPKPGSPEVISLTSGIEVQVGTRMGANGLEVGRFFPTEQEGLVTIMRNEMEAIQKIWTP